MAWLEPKKVKVVKTPEAAIKFYAKIENEPVRSIRLVRCSGMSEDDPDRTMKFFVGAVIIDRYEIRVREGSYMIFDTFTWAK